MGEPLTTVTYPRGSYAAFVALSTRTIKGNGLWYRLSVQSLLGATVHLDMLIWLEKSKGHLQGLFHRSRPVNCSTLWYYRPHVRHRVFSADYFVFVEIIHPSMRLHAIIFVLNVSLNFNVWQRRRERERVDVVRNYLLFVNLWCGIYIYIDSM